MGILERICRIDVNRDHRQGCKDGSGGSENELVAFPLRLRRWSIEALQEPD
jgi:hypothetical protein